MISYEDRFFLITTPNLNNQYLSINIKKPIPVVVNDEFAKTLGAKKIEILRKSIKSLQNNFVHTSNEITLVLSLDTSKMTPPKHQIPNFITEL